MRASAPGRAERNAARTTIVFTWRHDTQRTKLIPKAACWNWHDHAEGRPMNTSEHRKQSFSDRRSRKLSSELLARTYENTGTDNLEWLRFPNVKHQNVECGRPSAYHRRLSVVKKHHEHSSCHRDTGNSHCCEGDAQSFIEGKEVQLARDAGGTLSIGPELRWANIALSGTWTQKRKKQTRTQSKSWQKGWNGLSFDAALLTSCVANLSISTWNAVKTADGFSFPAGHPCARRTTLTADGNGDLKKV